MSSVETERKRQEFQDKLRRMPPAQWVQDMIDHYHRTGSYRPQDLRRLLGDPNRAVEIGPNAKLPSFLSSARNEQG